MKIKQFFLSFVKCSEKDRGFEHKYLKLLSGILV